MYGTASDPNSSLQSLFLGIDTFEGGQQGRVDVQEFTWKEYRHSDCETQNCRQNKVGQMLPQQLLHTSPFLHKGPSEDSHESGQADQFHSKLLQHSVDGAVELCPAAVQLMVHHLLETKH